MAERTVYYWREDFNKNGHRFSESLIGKAVQSWILDNPAMKGQAKSWLRSKVGRRPKKGEAHFQIRDFQDYLNQVLLPEWKIPKWKGMKAATKITKTSEYLQVSESCALARAHSLGMCYSRKRKWYYVDGHDSPDVPAHRATWLAKEADLEK